MDIAEKRALKCLLITDLREACVASDQRIWQFDCGNMRSSRHVNCGSLSKRLPGQVCLTLKSIPHSLVTTGKQWLWALLLGARELCFRGTQLSKLPPFCGSGSYRQGA